MEEKNMRPYRPRIPFRKEDPGFHGFQALKKKLDAKFIGEVLKLILTDMAELDPKGYAPEQYVDSFYKLKLGASIQEAPTPPVRKEEPTPSSRPKKTKKKVDRIKLEGFDPNAPLPDEDEDSSDAMNAAMSGPAL